MNQEKVGRFIRELRTEKEMTQQELAEKLGVTDSAISKWETGRGAPDISYLIPLANELNISLLELLNGEKGDDDSKAVIELIKDSEKKSSLWKKFSISIINILLSIMTIILVFGYIIPFAYENSDNKGITRVLSASMEPKLKAGASIIYDKVDIETIKKNDIVVFNYIDENGAFLAGDTGLMKVIHRVIEVRKDENGNINLITQGDQNIIEDSMPVTSHNFVGKYNRNSLKITSFFLKEKVQNHPFVLIFLIISISIIVIFDIIQYCVYINKRAS